MEDYKELPPEYHDISFLGSTQKVYEVTYSTYEVMGETGLGPGWPK
jgi:hypothetical protein